MPNWINRTAKIGSLFYCPGCCKTTDISDINYDNLLSESPPNSPVIL